MKRIAFLLTQLPRAGALAGEGFDALLMGSAFAQCTAVFVGDGVWQLAKGQQPEQQGARDFSRSFAALPDYGVTDILCSAEALATAGLAATGLVVEVTAVPESDLPALLAEHDQVLSF